MEETAVMNNPMIHPSCLIPTAFTHEIILLSGEAERLGVLHPQQLAMIYDQKWFKLFVPLSRGGLEMSLPDALGLEEGLAWADGSLGWTVTLCAGANWFIGFLDPELYEDLFNDPSVCLAGSGRDSGVAGITPTGYEITGTWRYATGAPHATAFTANCRIEKDGKSMLDREGRPVVQAFLLAKEEVTVHEDWMGMGMVATASHSFEVNHQYVPGGRSFRIDAGSSFLSQPIYQYPFLQFAETTLAVNSSGMAARFIDLAEKVLMEKAGRTPSTAANSDLLQLLENAKIRLQSARLSFYELVVFSWEDCVAGRLSPALLKKVSWASRGLAAEALRLVDELYPYCGLAAADRRTEINRVWRNMHTASQHSLLGHCTSKA
jgi:indole-3-acetate monooxygenase